MPWNGVLPCRTSDPVKNTFRRVSTARVRIMPRRISSRSSFVRLRAIASRRRNPSHAATSASSAWPSRSRAVTPGVVSVPAGSFGHFIDARNARAIGTRSFSISSAVFGSRVTTRSQTVAARALAKGCCSVTKVRNRSRRDIGQ